MKNNFLDYEVGTVLKEMYLNGDECYYIVGTNFIYANDYDDPEIRPHKFDTRYCYVADEDEKKQFIEDLKKNHLIWNGETGEVTREYEEVTLNVKVKVKPGMNVNGLLEKLNSQVENPFYVYGMKFEDATQYINKSDLIAEIEKKKDICKKVVLDLRTEENKDYYQGKTEAYSEISLFINTFETKVVDLEKEIKDYFDSQPIITRSKGLDYRLIPTGVDIAKHFYELGLKAQKGE